MSKWSLLLPATALLVCLPMAAPAAAQRKAPPKPAPVYAPRPVVVCDEEGRKVAVPSAPKPAAAVTPQTVKPGAKPAPKPAPLKFATPDAVARRMYESWKSAHRKQASYVATSAALDDLFSAEVRPMDAAPCEWTGEEYQCLYMDAEDEMLDFSINVKPHSKLGFLVTSISFRADD